MAPDIPTELKCMVLENLHDDKHSLPSCSVLSQAWQNPARAILFRSITLRAEHIPTKPHHRFRQAQVPDYESFVKALPPFLLHLVRDLEMSGKAFPGVRGELEELEEFYGYDEDDEDEEAERDEFYQPPEREISWTTLELDVIVRILAALPKLKHLSLSTIVFGLTDIPDVSLVMLKKITLRDFATRGRNDLLCFFDTLGADEVTLDVFHIRAQDEEEDVPPVYVPVGLALARSLDVCGDPDALRVLRAARGEPPSLTSLTVRVRASNELSELYRLLGSVAPSLSRIFLDMYHTFSVAKPFVVLFNSIPAVLQTWDLSFLKHLTHFELRVRLGYPETDVLRGLQLVTTILSSCHLPPSVSHITLHFDFPFFLPQFVAEQSWSALEQALRNFGGLQCLEFAITHSLDGDYHTISDSDQEEVKMALWAAFASVKNILSISFP